MLFFKYSIVTILATSFPQEHTTTHVVNAFVVAQSVNVRACSRLTVWLVHLLQTAPPTTATSTCEVKDKQAGSAP